MYFQIEMSKNAVTVEHLRLACRHVEEMLGAGVSENFAIRTLELFADVFAKRHMGGRGKNSPHHVDQVELWSLAAISMRDSDPSAKGGSHFRVEHGTPRRGFARRILKFYKDGMLNEGSLAQLVENQWKLAVITLEEDRLLNKKARSTLFETPEERWRSVGIEFPPVG